MGAANRERALAFVLLASIAGFALLIHLAIVRYPGGTWFDRTAPGHDLFRNFLCDLTQPIALNGRDNPGVGLARACMVVLDVGLLCLWLSIPRLCDPTPLARWLVGLGTISFVGVVAVPLTPSLRLGALHAVAVLCATLPGIAAGVLASIMLARSPHRLLSRLSSVLLIVSAIDAAIYAVHTLAGGPPPLALPVLQRIAMVVLLTWMAAVALTMLSREP